jgi:Ser/Thr protein kinase RdoA (MazF antagonist)
MIKVPESALESIAASYGVAANRLYHFGGGEESSDGIVYSYPYGDTQRLLKIMAIQKDNQRVGLLCFESRLEFMRYLGENGARIVFPQLSPRETLYETYLDEKYLWVGYSMEIASGRTPHDKTWDTELFRKWGATIGTLHRLTQEYPTWRALIDPETGEENLTWEQEWESFYNWIQDEEVKSKWVMIKKQLVELPVTRQSFGFIHNDPHIWNLLYDGTNITLLDFDVANHHWFANDIAIACQHVLIFLSGGMNGPVNDREKLMGFLRNFLIGYSRENQLSSECLKQLDLFVAYRRILMFTVMNDWIQSNSRLHDSWKRMILKQPEIVSELYSG